MSKIISLVLSGLVIWVFLSFCNNCYFGKVDENGERITDMQVILQEEMQKKTEK